MIDDLVKRRWAPLVVSSVLILLALVIILLWVRKRFHRSSSAADDPGLPPSNRFKSARSKEVILDFLCCRNEARVEPASNAAPESHLKPSPGEEEEEQQQQQQQQEEEEEEEEEEDKKVQRRRRKISCETSRVLYTIEEEREETASYGSSKEEATPFSTSTCASPQSCTPPAADGNAMFRTGGDGIRSTPVSFSF